MSKIHVHIVAFVNRYYWVALIGWSTIVIANLSSKSLYSITRYVF